MIIDEIKKDNMQAMKDKNANARAVYSVVMNKYMLMNINLKTQGKDMTDVEMIAIIQKTIKELGEEAENYLKVGKKDEYDNIMGQREMLNKYLPKMMSEQEIVDIIATLDDNSMPFVMKYFKANYEGKVDMGMVNKVLRGM